MTPATVRHQRVVRRLAVALEAVCPDYLRIVWEQEVRLGGEHRRNPDVLAINAAAFDLDGYSYPPSEETKPALALHTYQLGETGQYWRPGCSPKAT